MEKTTFDSLTKPEKRVAIAKDVIAQIKTEFYIPATDNYLEINFKNEGMYKGNVKKNVDKIKNCEVCAIGSCLVSITLIKNRLGFEDVNGGFIYSDTIKSLLKSVFYPRQLFLMETAFEQNTMYDMVGKVVYAKDALKAEFTLTNKEKEGMVVYENMGDTEERLIAIMENIIENEGEFKV